MTLTLKMKLEDHAMHWIETSLFAIALSFFCWKSSSAVIRWEIVGVKGESVNNLSKPMWPRNFTRNGQSSGVNVINLIVSLVKECLKQGLKAYNFVEHDICRSADTRSQMQKLFQILYSHLYLHNLRIKKYKSSFPSSPVVARNRLWTSEGDRKWEQMVSKIFGRQIAFR